MDIDKLIDKAFVRHSQEERMTLQSLVEMVEQVMGEKKKAPPPSVIDIDTGSAGSAYERAEHYLVWGAIHPKVNVDSLNAVCGLG